MTSFLIFLTTSVLVQSSTATFSFLNLLSGRTSCDISLTQLADRNNILEQQNFRLRMDHIKMERQVKDSVYHIKKLKQEKDEAERLFVQTWKINQNLLRLVPNAGHNLQINPHSPFTSRQGCAAGSKPYKSKCIQLHFYHGNEPEAKRFCQRRGGKMFQTSLDTIPDLMTALDISEQYYGIAFFVDIKYNRGGNSFSYSNGTPFQTSSDVLKVSSNPGQCVQFDSFKNKHRLSTKPCDTKNLYVVCETKHERG